MDTDFELPEGWRQLGRAEGTPTAFAYEARKGIEPGAAEATALVARHLDEAQWSAVVWRPKGQWGSAERVAAPEKFDDPMAAIGWCMLNLWSD